MHVSLGGHLCLVLDLFDVVLFHQFLNRDEVKKLAAAVVVLGFSGRVFSLNQLCLFDDILDGKR